MDAPHKTYAPRGTFLIAVSAYAFCAKLLPFVLMQFGMSITPGDTSYPWNFSPFPAICLFGAAYFRDLRVAFGLPLLAWLAADCGIAVLVGRVKGWDEGLAHGFYGDQVFQYAGYGLVILCGTYLRTHRGWLSILGVNIGASTAFYLISNFGVWAAGGLYPATLSGLAQCYWLGLPYYREFLLGTLFFSAILFSPVGIRALGGAERRPALSPVTEPASAEMARSPGA